MFLKNINRQGTTLLALFFGRFMGFNFTAGKLPLSREMLALGTLGYEHLPFVFNQGTTPGL
jgi:hypothetical protein